MAKAINFKLASLIGAASLHGVACLGPAAKAIEIDPFPNDGKCYTITNNQYIDYDNGSTSEALLKENPWFGNPTISRQAAIEFQKETRETWRFAYDAAVRDQAELITRGDQNFIAPAGSLRTWYYARSESRKNFYTPDTRYWNFAEGFEHACFDDTPGEDVVEDLLPELPDEIEDLLVNDLRGADQAKIGRVINALVLPRNINASGGLATQAYINDLADTILERLPSRKFQRIQITEETTEVEIQH